MGLLNLDFILQLLVMSKEELEDLDNLFEDISHIAPNYRYDFLADYMCALINRKPIPLHHHFFCYMIEFNEVKKLFNYFPIIYRFKDQYFLKDILSNLISPYYYSYRGAIKNIIKNYQNRDKIYTNIICLSKLNIKKVSFSQYRGDKNNNKRYNATELITDDLIELCFSDGKKQREYNLDKATVFNVRFEDANYILKVRKSNNKNNYEMRLNDWLFDATTLPTLEELIDKNCLPKDMAKEVLITRQAYAEEIRYYHQIINQLYKLLENTAGKYNTKDEQMNRWLLQRTLKNYQRQLELTKEKLQQATFENQLVDYSTKQKGRILK